MAAEAISFFYNKVIQQTQRTMAPAAAEQFQQRNTPEDVPPIRNHSPSESARMRFALASGARPLEGYTVKRGVGLGGFGEVYFAVSDAGKEVALKRINRNLDIELRGVRQCLNLKHINLVDLYDIRHDDLDQHWVVMEFVGGESLTAALDRHPEGMPAEEIHHWMSGLLSGVGYLHSHGIVHRDLKPGNIFADEGVVKIGDYGLSKFISCSRRSGHTESVGTLHYMAPEIGQGRYGKEIDIYALGVLLHELVTGRVPFDGESSQEIIIKHLTAKPELTGIEEPYRSVIAKALEKDPERRYREVAEIASALELTPAAESHSAGHSSHPGSNYQATENKASHDSQLGETVALVTAEEVLEEKPRQQPPRRKKQACRSALNDSDTCLGRDGQIGVLLIVAAVLSLVFGGPAALMLVAALALVYASSTGVRIWGAKSAASRASTPQLAEPLPPQEYLPDGRPRYFTKSQLWRREMMAALRRKSNYRRGVELTDGMLVSAIIAAVLCLVMMVVAGQPLTESTAAWSLYLWLYLTTTLTSWALLWAGKAWEGREGDQVLRRFLLLAMGLAMGAAAWTCQSILMVDMTPADLGHAITGEHLHETGSYDASGAPLLGAYLGYFAGLMIVPRWWMLSDPLRKHRLSVWPLVVSGVWAFVLNYFWAFPQPWGWMIAVAAAASVQMAAPWLRRERKSV